MPFIMLAVLIDMAAIGVIIPVLPALVGSFATSQAEQDRAKVQAFVDRANVKERLQAMGLSGLAARDRVASLSEAEVHALAQRVDTMPAGADLSNQDLLLIILVALLLAVVF